MELVLRTRDGEVLIADEAGLLRAYSEIDRWTDTLLSAICHAVGECLTK